MAKAKRGLPEGFDLAIKADSPAILGDFLDEAAPAAPAPLERPQPAPGLAAVAEALPGRKDSPPGTNDRILPEPREKAVPPPLLEPLVHERATQRVVPLKPPRLEVSLNHETKRMIQELLLYIQQMLPQSPAKASEVFQGIISVLYRAKGSLDLSTIPRRGQWGTPTAKAFPFALGQAFARAIAEQYFSENSKRGVG